MTVLRIGHPPRLPYWVRARRLAARLLAYATAWTVLGWALYWLGDVHLFVPGMAIAAMVANPWRSKTSPRPAFGPGVGKAGPAVEHVSAARRPSGQYGLGSRRPNTPGLSVPPVALGPGARA